MKSYSFLNHTADIRLQITGSTLAELFSAAVLGMNEILAPGFCQQKKGFGLTHIISISSPELTLLLIDFLAHILTLTQEEKTIFCKIDFITITETSLKAKIFGRPLPAFKEDVKAVTYHEAAVKKNKEGNWETIIIFDI